MRALRVMCRSNANGAQQGRVRIVLLADERSRYQLYEQPFSLLSQVSCAPTAILRHERKDLLRRRQPALKCSIASRACFSVQVCIEGQADHAANVIARLLAVLLEAVLPFLIQADADPLRAPHPFSFDSINHVRQKTVV